MENHKRKREAVEPRIKYHVEQSGRSFERILKENSREELCEVVRKKLNLDSKTNLELAQIREGVVYDLEDDEDFEAFKSAAYAYSSLDVRVSYPIDTIPGNVPNARPGPSSVSVASCSPNPQGDRQKGAGQKPAFIADQPAQEHSLVTGTSSDVDGGQGAASNRSNRMLSSANEGITAPPKKKRKKDHVDLDPTTTAERTKRKKTKVKESDVHTLKSVLPVVTRAEPPSRLSVSHDPQADPGTSASDSLKLSYAAFLKMPQRTASEILAEYSSRNVSRSKPRQSVSVVDDTVTSTSVKAKAKIQKKGESVDVGVANVSVKDRPKPRLAKSRLNESWTPEVTEETPSPPSNRQPSVSDSSKATDAATLPQPLTKLSPHVSRTIYSPRRRGSKQSPANAKQASSCPICLSLPFHLRFKCPVITSGADAITERIAQLKAESGKEDLVEELEEWLQKDLKKKGSHEAALKETEAHSNPSPPAAQSKHQGSPLPPWAPIVSLQTHPSEVIVESTHEGSESATSSSSEQEGKLNSSTESSSVSGSRPMSPSVNLERVNLDSLIRGPLLNVAPMKMLKVDDENDEEEAKENPEDDDREGDIGLLEEEEEEKPVPKRLRGLNFLRSKSPETVDGDEDEDSPSDVEQLPKYVATGMASSRSSTQPDHPVETEPSVRDATDENGMERDHETTVPENVDAEPLANTDPGSHLEPGDLHATPAPPAKPTTSKSAFPSLSQLSFDKFKPSFLLTNVFSQSQNNVKDSGGGLSDDHESEEDESSDSEKESHIPKDKRAGVGILTRSKSRGLLH